MRIVRRILLLGVVLGVVYGLCLLYPEPFFRVRTRAGALSVYAPSAAPAALLQEVQGLLGRSPLYDPSLRQRVFICASKAQFAFFARGRTELAGLCDDRLTGNVFIRPADLARSRLLGVSGWVDPRPLSFFIAHEITHHLEARYVGRWNLRVPAWLWEGYADYIGWGGRRPILSDRYASYVAYLLDQEHRDIRELLRNPPAEDSVAAAAN